MKMKSVFVVLFAMCLISVMNVQGQIYFSTSFSEAEGYTNGPVMGQPAGSDAVWQDGASVPSELYAYIENEALVMYQNGDDQDTWVFIEFPNQNSGVMTVTWDWQYVGPEDSNIDVGVCISDKFNFEFDGNPLLGWPEQSAMTRMQQDSAVIDARNGDWSGGGTYDAFEAFSYTDGVKIYMRCEIALDPADQTYSVYAQKEGGDEVQLAENFGFRREYIDGLNTVSIWVDGSAAETRTIIDNIVISGPTPVTDWALY
ncbi:MAG: hypothetical protein JXR73_05625 [Candidatus Omnitrophica bacterium]|nr:hypothetical protein [Candidatus Omnitrophota bacterium]